ncbi:hypothetical protein [Pseudonocardia spinosispora]|uniref:hypothetical protein n=1 Tax=Pseudonocardia spinosispora TaxID=103441 RepID=UPI00048EB668|nr:hypothetical protein [Pseudonocardia spinosispora]
MIPILSACVLALGMYAFGAWGLRNADNLVPPGFSAYGKAKKARQMRRSARLIQFSGGFLVVLAIAHFAWESLSG